MDDTCDLCHRAASWFVRVSGYDITRRDYHLCTPHYASAMVRTRVRIIFAKRITKAA